jgi:hypothetical protein
VKASDVPTGPDPLEISFDRHFEVFSLQNGDQAVRGRIIVLSVQLETVLKELLIAYSPQKSVMAKLLGRSLSSFDSRIEACFALGLITPEEHADLRIFKEIRNKFAHSLSTNDKQEAHLELASRLTQFTVTEDDIIAQPAMAGVKSFFETAGLGEKLEVQMKMLSWKLTVRIDAAEQASSSVGIV